MLAGVERLVDLVGPRESGLAGAALSEVEAAVRSGDIERLEATDGHFAVAARDGQTVRLARTIGLPLRYFVAKRYHGPFLVVADRIERLYEYCCRAQDRLAVRPAVHADDPGALPCRDRPGRLPRPQSALSPVFSRRRSARAR